MIFYDRPFIYMTKESFPKQHFLSPSFQLLIALRNPKKNIPTYHLMTVLSPIVYQVFLVGDTSRLLRFTRIQKGTCRGSPPRNGCNSLVFVPGKIWRNHHHFMKRGKSCCCCCCGCCCLCFSLPTLLMIAISFSEEDAENEKNKDYDEGGVRVSQWINSSRTPQAEPEKKLCTCHILSALAYFRLAFICHSFEAHHFRWLTTFRYLLHSPTRHVSHHFGGT